MQMGNNNCASASEKTKSVSPLGDGPSSEDVLRILRSTDPLRTPDLRSLLLFQSTPSPAMVCQACKQGHWEALIFFHRRLGCDPHSPVKHEGYTAIEWSSADQDESVAPSKKILKRQREKVRVYLQLTPSSIVVSQNPSPSKDDNSNSVTTSSKSDDFETDDRRDQVLLLVLIAAFRFGDRAWLERTLQDAPMASPAVFRLLIEAIHAADVLLVNDLLAR